MTLQSNNKKIWDNIACNHGTQNLCILNNQGYRSAVDYLGCKSMFGRPSAFANATSFHQTSQVHFSHHRIDHVPWYTKVMYFSNFFVQGTVSQEFSRSLHLFCDSFSQYIGYLLETKSRTSFLLRFCLMYFSKSFFNCSSSFQLSFLIRDAITLCHLL